MSREEMSNAIWEMVRKEKRKNQVVQTEKIMDYVIEAINSVEIDRKLLYDSVKEAFHNTNPLNGILGIFGFRLIRENDAEKIVAEKNNAYMLSEALRVNEKKLNKTVSKLAEDLSGLEADMEKKERNHIDKINDLTEQLDKEQLKTAQFQRENKMQLSAIADHAQYILSKTEDRQADYIKQLGEMLSDLGIRIYWREDELPISEKAMFQEIKTDQPMQHKEKPCLMYQEEIIARGVYFVLNEEEYTEM